MHIIFTIISLFTSLELTLEKKEPTTWPLVVCGDTRGEMVIDPNEVRLIHERLAHLTTEEPVSLTRPLEGTKPSILNSLQV